jgi:hypothetical protein
MAEFRRYECRVAFDLRAREGVVVLPARESSKSRFRLLREALFSTNAAICGYRRSQASPSSR